MSDVAAAASERVERGRLQFVDVDDGITGAWVHTATRTSVIK